MKRHIMLGTALGAMVVLAGCASRTESWSGPSDSASSASASAAVASAFPTGTWTATCIRENVRVMEFGRDGSWTLDINDEPVSSGTYTTAGGDFTFETDDHCATQDHETAVYTWNLKAEELTFETVEDDCTERVGVMVDVVWRPVE